MVQVKSGFYVRYRKEYGVNFTKVSLRGEMCNKQIVIKFKKWCMNNVIGSWTYFIVSHGSYGIFCFEHASEALRFKLKNL